VFSPVLLAIATLVSAPAQPQGADHPISYSVRKIVGTWVHVVKVDLSSEQVKVSGVVSRYRGQAEPVSEMVSRAHPIVAMTGTFHSVRSKLPVGDIVIDGECVNRGDFPSCLAIDWFSQPKILTYEWAKRQDWRNYEYLVGGGIRVLKSGVVNPDIRHRRDHHVFKPNPRTAAGITRQHKLLLVATRERVTLSRLGKIMKALGARDAISLDGGSSVCLYYKGKMLVSAGRKLTNLLVVYDRPEAYSAHKGGLGPVRLQKNARR
jgi:hypothetical protein